MQAAELHKHAEKLLIDLGNESWAVVSVAIVTRDSDPGEIVAPPVTEVRTPTYMEVLNVGDALTTGRVTPFSGPEMFQRL